MPAPIHQFEPNTPKQAESTSQFSHPAREEKKKCLGGEVETSMVEAEGKRRENRASKSDALPYTKPEIRDSYL
jgi:hypothetical protein